MIFAEGGQDIGQHQHPERDSHEDNTIQGYSRVCKVSDQKTGKAHDIEKVGGKLGDAKQKKRPVTQTGCDIA